MRKIYFLLLTILFAAITNAQVSTYNFTSAIGTYTEISGGTLLSGIGVADDDNGYSGVPIGFTFVYHGVSYTTLGVSANGYASFSGVAPGNFYNGVSIQGLANAVHMFSEDLDGTAAGCEIEYMTTGAVGSRVFTLQWKNWGFFSSGGNEINFQLQLYETTNVIQFVYKPGTPATSQTCQVGLTGVTVADFNSRTTTTDWSATTASAVNTAQLTWSSTIFPVSGLTYTFTPPPPCVTPANQPTGLVLTPGVVQIGGSFTAAVGSPDRYLVVKYPNGASPTNPVNGTTYTVGGSLGLGTIISTSNSTSFTATALSPSTAYDFYIYSYNSLCAGGPLYLTTSPLFGTQTTLACSGGLAGGSYTVGATGTYLNLTAALTAINGGIAGPVVLQLQNDYSSVGETFPITFQPNACVTAVNTVTVKPGAGVTATISGSSATSIIKLNGADYITIDGSNSGTTSQDLTIKNTNASTSSGVVWLASTTTLDGATNNTIKNCIVNGNTSTTTLISIVSSGSVLGGVAETANSNNTYQNNTTGLSQYGIAVVGPAASENGTVITNNNVGTVANAHGYRGLFISNQSGTIVSGNTIQHVLSSGSLTAGIVLAGTGTGVSISNNTISNVASTAAASGVNSVTGIYIGTTNTNTTINANTITGIASTTTSGYGVRAITIQGSNTTVSNNMISDIYNYQDATVTFYGTLGITVDGAVTGIKIYYNTVNMFGSHPGYSSNTTGGVAACMYINSTTAGGVDIRNNIFTNSYDNSTSTGDKAYAIYSLSANTVFSNIDNNDYYVSGTGTPILGYLGGDRTTLAALQTAFGGNTKSINFSPTYTSNTDLHLTNGPGVNWCLNFAATPIATFTTDFDGNTRGSAPDGPDMGADEFSPTGLVINNPATVCSGSSVDLTAAAVTAGSIGGLTFTYWTDAAATVALVNPNAVTVAGTYYIKALNGTCTLIKPVVVTFNPLPGISGVIVQPSTCVSNDGSITITVSGTPGPYTYSWTGSGTGLNPTAQNQTGLSVGTYTVTVTDQTTGCQNSQAFALLGPGGCICPTISSLTTNPTPTGCINTNVTLNATGLANMGVAYGITFKYSTTPLADPYVGGTLIATVPNASLTAGGTAASTTTTFAAANTYYIYAVLSPTPPDPTCRPSQQVSMPIYGNPSFTSQPVNRTICAGQNTTFVVTTSGSPVTYQWQIDQGSGFTNLTNVAPFSGVTTATLTVTGAGTVYNGNSFRCVLGPCGGATSNVVTLTVNPLPVVSVGPNGLCAPVTLIASGTSNTYSWSPATGLNTTTGTTVIATPAVNTTYTVTGTITATGCTNTATVNVLGNSTGAVLSGATTICNGVTANLVVTITGGVGPFTVVYNNGTSNVTVNGYVSGSNIPVTPATTTTYTLISVTGANGCAGSGINATPVTITVNPLPTISVSPNNQCSPVTLTATGNSNTYSWSPATGLNTTTGPTVTSTTTATITYTVTGTITATGCTNSATATVLGTPLTPVLSPTSANVCLGSIVQLNATATPTAVWSPATGLYTDVTATTPYVAGAQLNTVYAKPTITTTYSVTSTSGTCPSPAATITVTVTQPLSITTQPANTTVCAGANATFTVVAAGNLLNYQWQVSTNGGTTYTNLTNTAPYNNVNSATLNITGATTAISTYRYRVVISNSCGSVTSNGGILTVTALPVLTTVPLSNRICISDSLVNLVGTPVGGVWSGIGVYGNTFIPMRTAIGTYTLTYTYTANGCTNTSTVVAKVEDCPDRIRQFDNKGVLLYPNPNDGHFSIRINTTLYNYLGMRVYTMSGSLVNVQSWTNLQYGRIIPVDLSKLPGGVYQVKLFYDDGSRTDEKTYNVVIAR